MCKQWEDNDNYIVIDTDRVFGKAPCKNKYEEKIKNIIDSVYSNDIEKILYENVDMWYKMIIDLLKDTGKIVVINSAMLKYIKDLSIIKGKIIILRTSINKCYERCIQRFKEKNPNATEEEIREYSTRKKKMYEWYNYLNDFILKVEEL